MKGREYEPMQHESARARARAILRMGMGEQVGDESARPGIVAAFDAAFAADDPRRQFIAERLRHPVEPSQSSHRWHFKADIGAPVLASRRPRLATTIYIVGFAQYVKIGITERDVQHRIAGLQTGCPERLKIYATFPGDLMLEKALHERFARLRRNGEWFLREGELATWIDEGCPADAP